MKRYNNLWDQITDRDNIERAFLRSQRGKKHYKEVMKINQSPEPYLLAIQDSLIKRTFKNSSYEIIERMEGGKLREIKKLPYYPDRIIHHAIMQVLEPIWIKSLIKDTWQSIPGRGIHTGVKRIKLALKDISGTKYALKMDVRKFYPSIDNGILKQVIRKKIKDKNVLWLLDEIIDSTSGLPIGNYISQILGNLYLSDYDHRMKEHHRLKYYFRYCDDIVILSDSKTKLRTYYTDSVNYLKDSRNLEIKSNWQIFPVDARGIDFLGYRFFHNFTLVRKSIIKRFKETVNKPTIPQVMSYIGWLEHADTHNLLTKYITNEVFHKIKFEARASGISNPLQGIYL
jgi:RNA-directed DNA polymerase